MIQHEKYLQKVVLHNISDDSKLVKVATTAACAKILLPVDLDALDVFLVPHRLENNVRKSLR